MGRGDSQRVDAPGYDSLDSILARGLDAGRTSWVLRGGGGLWLGFLDNPLTPRVCRWGFVGSVFTAPARSNLQGRGSRHEIG